MQQDPHPCIFVEYAPWAGVLISTNSTYPHGISRSRIFDRGAGGVVVSFNPDGVIRRCGNLDLRNGLLRVQLQLFAVPKDGSKVRNEVKFSICEDSENPRTLYNFAPVVFNIDKIAKSRSSGLSLSYDFYNFFFSACLMYNYDHLLLFDGTTLFKITSLSATEKENRKGKKRGSHFASQSTHHHEEQDQHQSSTPQQVQLSQFLLQHQSHPPVSNHSPSPSQPQPIVKPPLRHSPPSQVSSSSNSSSQLCLPLSKYSAIQPPPQNHHLASSTYSLYRSQLPPHYSSHGPSSRYMHSTHSSHTSRPSSHQWKYSSSRNPTPMHISYTTPTTIPIASPSHEVTVHVAGTGLTYCNCAYVRMDGQLTIARFTTNVDGEEMIVSFYHPSDPQVVTIFLCAEDVIGTEFTLEFVGSSSAEKIADGRRTNSYGPRHTSLAEAHNGVHSPPLSPPLTPPRSTAAFPPPSVHYVPSQALRRLTKSHSPPVEPFQMVSLDRRRPRDSPTELTPPLKIQATPHSHPPSSPPSPTVPPPSLSSMRSPPSSSTNYHSLINRFIAFSPQPTRADLTSSDDPLSPSISNHETTSSPLVPLYAVLKINASKARMDHFLTFLSASCLRELLLVNKEVYRFLSTYVSSNFSFYSDAGPWRYCTPKRLTSVNSLTFITSQTPLTHIRFSNSFNTPIEVPLPPTLIHLSFGEDFNQSLELLPAALLHLSFGYCFNQPLYDLPANLQFLSFGGYFNQPLHFPRKLLYLKFGFAFNQPLTDLPSSIQYLAFGTHFNQPLSGVPASLVYLAISPDYQLSLDNVPLVVLKFSRRVTRGEIGFSTFLPPVQRFFRELGVGEYNIEYATPSRITLERPGKLTAVMIVGTGISQHTKAFVQMLDQSYPVNISYTRDFESPDHILASVYLYHPSEPQIATVYFWEAESYIRQSVFKVEFVREMDHVITTPLYNCATQANTSFFVNPSRKDSNSFSVTSSLFNCS